MTRTDPSVVYVGVCGGHGIGKSTALEKLETRLTAMGFTVHRISMADELRRELSTVLPRILTKQKHHPLERAALQFTAETNRQFDQNYYLYQFLRAVDEIVSESSEIDSQPPERIVVLVDDCYHWNEAMAMDVLITVHIEDLVGDVSRPDPIDYVPESIRQTESILRHAHIVFPGTHIPVHIYDPNEHTLSHPNTLRMIANLIHRTWQAKVGEELE